MFYNYIQNKVDQLQYDLNMRISVEVKNINLKIEVEADNMKNVKIIYNRSKNLQNRKIMN